MLRFAIGLAMLFLVGCQYRETTREVGHKGKARANPYLAGERFLEKYGFSSGEGMRWPELDGEEVMIVSPLAVLESAGRTQEFKSWVREGGHLVVLVQGGEAQLNDWRTVIRPPRSNGDVELPYRSWLGEVGMDLHLGELQLAKKVEFEGNDFEISMETPWRVGEDGFLHSVEWGDGRITVVCHAAPFRNRYLGDHDHAALLLALAESTGYEGKVTFLRYAEESFWALIGEKAWPFLVALGVLTLVWLWRNLPRFGPYDDGEPSTPLLSSDHHLESLGGYHWDLDKGRGLLLPLRESIIERGTRLGAGSGQPDSDVFQLLAERAGISRENVERAMTLESPRDTSNFTRLVADLQKIHQSLP